MSKINTGSKTVSMLQKPDTIDTPITTTSPTAIKSNTPVVYEKPNAYDEKPPVVITASRHGSRSSRVTVDSYSSRYFQKNNPSVIRHSSTASSTSCTSTVISPHTPVQSPPLSPVKATSAVKKCYTSQIDRHSITSYVLSQSTPTIQTTLTGHQDEIPFHYIRPSSPANSVVEQEGTCASKSHATDIVAAVAALLSNDSGIVSSFFLQNRTRSKPQKQQATKKKTNNNVIVYNFKKAGVFKPNQHNIYLHIEHPDDGDEEDVLAYRKIQPGSSWGFHSMLYCNRNDGQGIKVAEARRRAFQKTITIESADYEDTLVDDITQTHIPNNKLRAPATNNIYCQELVKRSQSNILFEYETWFHGSRMRWTRPSLLSHDFTCEIKLTKPEKKLQQYKKSAAVRDEGFIDSDSDSDEDDHDHHSHRTCRRWKLIAEFDSHNLNFLNQDLGTLSIDLDILNQVEKERCDLLEANIVMTCSTLIDLIREIMGKR